MLQRHRFRTIFWVIIIFLRSYEMLIKRITFISSLHNSQALCFYHFHPKRSHFDKCKYILIKKVVKVYKRWGGNLL